MFVLRVEPPVGPPLDRDARDAPIVIGRGADADVVCNDGSMSRRHARVLREGERWIVEDLGARNGTFVNGTRIEGRAALAPGDVLKMGATVARLLDPAAPDARPVPDGGMRPGAWADAGLLGQTIYRPLGDGGGAERLADDTGIDPVRLAARLKAVNDFHRAIGQAVSREALLDLLLDQLFAALQPEEGVILLRQADGSLATAAGRRLPGATAPLLVSQRLTDEVVGKNTAALVTDAEYDDRFASSHSVVTAGVQGILAAPFTDAGGCLGMVAIYSRTRVRRFTADDLDLLVSLASAAALRIRNVALAEEAATRRVEDHELALASEIQMGMLPRALPARPEVDLAARLIPARAVGGDLYDFLVLGRELWFIVADAAGKGVSAALFMAVTRTLFRAMAREGESVGAVGARMNAELARDNDRQVFVTALLGRLALDTGEIVCCNAGHHPALRLSPGGAIETLGAGGDIAFGILEDVTYDETRAVLAPGDLLVAYTDGVTEAIDGAGTFYSDARLLEAIARCGTGRAADFADAVVRAVQAFAAGVPQEDDITVLALRYR